MTLSTCPYRSFPNLKRQVWMLAPLVLLILASNFVSLRAQSAYGSIRGVVRDASGQPVANVSIDIEHVETKAIRSIKTNNQGLYAAPQLPPGHYNLTAARTDFASATLSNILLSVNQDLEIPLRLSIETTTQQIEVSETGLAVETTNGTLGTVITAQQIRDLPLNGRQFTQLILLTPGAVPKQANQQNAFVVPMGASGISPAVSGLRPQQNNFTIDGVSNNAIFTNTWAVSPPPDAIREFRVQTNITDAEFGNSPGANVNVAVLSGTNSFHGAFWEYLRNDKISAANYFTNATGRTKNPYKQNQYGLTFGGPVLIPGVLDGRKSKTYVFGYWEDFKARQGQTVLLNVPQPERLGGNFSALAIGGNALDSAGRPIIDALDRSVRVNQLYNPFSTRSINGNLVRDPFPGNIIPASSINQAAVEYLRAAYPVPNLTTAGANFVANVATATDSRQYGVKLDQDFGSNHRLMGAYYAADADRFAPVGLNFGSQVLTNPGKIASLVSTKVLNSNTVLTLRYGYTDTNFARYQTPAGRELLNRINAEGIYPEIYGLAGVPAVNVAGITATNQTILTFGPQQQHTVSGNLSKLVGKHNFSFGFRVARLYSEDDGRSLTLSFDQFPTSAIYGAGVNATNTGNSLASMIVGLPSRVLGQVGSTNAITSGWQQGFFADDTWRVNSRLTLRFGLRYDYYQPLHYRKPVSGFDERCACVRLSDPFPPTYPTANAKRSWYDPQRRNFQPRFSFAYKLTDDTVVRSGFALFNDFNNSYVQQQLILRLSWPWGAGINLGPLNRANPELVFDQLPSASSILPQPGQPALNPQWTWNSLQTNRTPYTMLWNFQIEHLLAKKYLLRAAYVGSGSRHLYIQNQFNAPTPDRMGPGPVGPRSPYPSINQLQLDRNEGNANYNGLQLFGERRFQSGLQFAASYTWSHCFSYQDAAQDFSNQNPYDRRPDYSSCDHDARQTLTSNATWQLPVRKSPRLGAIGNTLLADWQISGIVSLLTGLPFNATLPFDNANIAQTGGVQRAQLIGEVLPAGFRRTPEEWYNRAAFGVPAPFTFGNLGRNILRADGIRNLDLTVMKDFRLAETVRLRFAADAFNALNHTMFNAPNGSVTTAPFMRVQAARASRDYQFSLKLTY